MTETTIYYCDCCHNGFHTKEDAIECEKTHTPVSVEVVKDKAEAPKTSREYPSAVNVTFATGETVRYHSDATQKKLTETFMALLSDSYESRIEARAREMAKEMVRKGKTEE